MKEEMEAIIREWHPMDLLFYDCWNEHIQEERSGFQDLDESEILELAIFEEES